MNGADAAVGDRLIAAIKIVDDIAAGHHRLGLILPVSVFYLLFNLRAFRVFFEQKNYFTLVLGLISLYQKGVLPEEERNSLEGHLSHIRYVDSSFYTKLQKKYFTEISELLKGKT